MHIIQGHNLRKIKIVPIDGGFFVFGFLDTMGLKIWKGLDAAPEQLAVGSRLDEVIDCTTCEYQSKTSLICVKKRALEYLFFPIDHKAFVIKLIPRWT